MTISFLKNKVVVLIVRKKCLVPKIIGFDYFISRTFFSCLCLYSKKPQTTQTRAFARAARRSRSFHSRAAAAAALELYEEIPNSY